MIRSFEPRDVPQVCALFSRSFRAGRNRRAGALATAIEATYLGSPAYRPERGSIVHVDGQGRIDGFMGLINITLRLGDRRLDAGVLSAYMADRPQANPAIGVSLIRAILARRMDVVFSDTANRKSLEMSQATRFSVLPLQSLEWTKILRPAGTAAYLLARRLGGAGAGGWSRLLGTPAAAIDTLLPRIAATGVAQRGLANTVDRAVTAAEFVSAAPDFVADFALRPAWEHDELSWLLAQAALQTKYGPLHLREVLDRGGRRAGLYLLYARQGGVATALQVLARPGREDIVVGHLLLQARALGAVCVRGAASRAAALGLMRQNGVVYRHAMSSVIWTADPQIAAAIRSGDVCLGGLAGETWARIFADTFA